MVKTELPQAESKEYTEKVVISSKSNKMNDILPLLEEEKQVVTEDGFSGTVKLDLSNLKIEGAGYGTSTKNVSTTRTYPNLDSADTQYIPKNNRRERKDLRTFGDSLAKRKYTEHQRYCHYGQVYGGCHLYGNGQQQLCGKAIRLRRSIRYCFQDEYG